MANNFVKLILLRWDQKHGGMMEFQYPKFKFPENQCMNIYNMHRMRSKAAGFGNITINLDDGKGYSCVTFYSGFGEGGYGGNYGKHVVGVSEKVIGLFLEKGSNSRDYEEVLALISTAILVENDDIQSRLEKVGKLIDKSRLLDKADELYDYLVANLYQDLGFSSEKAIIAKTLELKANKVRIDDLKEMIQDLRINPAKTAYAKDSEKILEYDKKIKQLTTQISLLTTQKQMNESIGSQKDEAIQSLKNDYIVIFGTLTDQIQMLENELAEIKGSTQAFVNDLNVILAEKIAENERLTQVIQDMKINE